MSFLYWMNYRCVDRYSKKTNTVSRVTFTTSNYKCSEGQLIIIAKSYCTSAGVNRTSSATKSSTVQGALRRGWALWRSDIICSALEKNLALDTEIAGSASSKRKTWDRLGRSIRRPIWCDSIHRYQTDIISDHWLTVMWHRQSDNVSQSEWLF